MSIKKSVIILVISAIILAVILLMINYQKSFKSNLSQPASGQKAVQQKALTDEEKRQQLFNVLKALNDDKTKENLTPAEERAQKEELLSALKALAK